MILFSRSFIRKRAISLATTGLVGVASLTSAHGPVPAHRTVQPQEIAAMHLAAGNALPSSEASPTQPLPMPVSDSPAAHDRAGSIGSHQGRAIAYEASGCRSAHLAPPVGRGEEALGTLPLTSTAGRRFGDPA
jgi:hypothetical protein